MPGSPPRASVFVAGTTTGSSFFVSWAAAVPTVADAASAATHAIRSLHRIASLLFSAKGLEVVAPDRSPGSWIVAPRPAFPSAWRTVAFVWARAPHSQGRVARRGGGVGGVREGQGGDAALAVGPP